MAFANFKNHDWTMHLMHSREVYITMEISRIHVYVKCKNMWNTQSKELVIIFNSGTKFLLNMFLNCIHKNSKFHKNPQTIHDTVTAIEKDEKRWMNGIN